MTLKRKEDKTMKKIRNVTAIMMILIISSSSLFAGESILVQFENGGIWKVDRPNHRCLVERGVWDRMPFDKKEDVLKVIYVEEKTWWELYDSMSGKLLGKVSSWGWKVYP